MNTILYFPENPAKYLFYDNWKQIEPYRWPFLEPLWRDTRCNDHFPNKKMGDSSESAWLSLIVHIILFEKNDHSLTAQDMFSSTSAKLSLLPIVASCEKRLLRREGDVWHLVYVFILWYLAWVSMYLKVGTTHFYHLALFNLVLGLTQFI